MRRVATGAGAVCWLPWRCSWWPLPIRLRLSGDRQLTALALGPPPCVVRFDEGWPPSIPTKAELRIAAAVRCSVESDPCRQYSTGERYGAPLTSGTRGRWRTPKNPGGGPLTRPGPTGSGGVPRSRCRGGHGVTVLRVFFGVRRDRQLIVDDLAHLLGRFVPDEHQLGIVRNSLLLEVGHQTVPLVLKRSVRTTGSVRDSNLDLPFGGTFLVERFRIHLLRAFKREPARSRKRQVGCISRTVDVVASISHTPSPRLLGLLPFRRSENLLPHLVA